MFISGIHDIININFTQWDSLTDGWVNGKPSAQMRLTKIQ